MQFISRAAQRPARPTLMALGTVGLSDLLLNTPALPRPTKALRWRPETDVHSGLRITDKLKNTNQFLANQVMVVRDELRATTWVATLETDGLYLSRIEGRHLTAHDLVASGDVVRASLALRKFDGVPFLTYVRLTNGQGSIFINGTEIATSSANADFPFLTIEQAPIGFAAYDAPTKALLTYKSIDTGQILVREVDPMTMAVGVEIDLNLPRVLGGLHIAISKGVAIGQVELVQGEKVAPAILRSSDYFATAVQPQLLDLTTVPHDQVVPARARLFVDTTGAVHSAVVVQQADRSSVLDVRFDDDRIVASITMPNVTHAEVAAFPKMPERYDPLLFGYGDGETDGAGVIATALSSGRLFAANSQSGGYSFPDPTLLNDDMQRMYIHSQTECYTRDRPNYVSMDYAFVEGDESGNPASSDLWLETWDMPLPLPIVEHTWEGDKLRLKIVRDGWFFPGQTSFVIEPTIAEITKAEFVDFREMTLEFNAAARVRGTSLTFETRNVFFYYQATVSV